MLKKKRQTIKEIFKKIGDSAGVGKKALALTLAMTILTAALPTIGFTASADTVTGNPAFKVIAYDISARIDIPIIGGATNYKVYLTKDSGLTDFTSASCVLNSDTYKPYAYVLNGDKDAVNPANTISIRYTNGGNNTYYFYFVTNNGSADTLQSSFAATTRATADCYWTSPGNYDTGWYGDGTQSNYTISTAAQVAGLAVLTNGLNGVTAVNFTGKTITLSAFVDLSANLWTPIGTQTNQFRGTFDGGNYDGAQLSGNNVVSSLHTNDGTKNYQGLFGYTSSGTIQNIGVVNGYVKGNAYVGGVVGLANGTITNCCNTGAVGAIGIVGGIVGGANSAITNCCNTGAVSGTSSSIGGVAGYAAAAISSCYNTGAVSGKGSVGGVVGVADGAITSCYNTGAVSGTYDYVGGVVGKAQAAITSCCNIGAVNSTTGNVGGIAGITYGGANTTNCCNTGAVNGTGSSVGGVVGNALVTISSCYNTGAVSGTGSSVGGVAGTATKIVSCYSAGTVTISSTSTLTYIYYDSSGTSGAFDPADKAALLTSINSGSAYCAAPTKYATGGVFSTGNPVNQGYPVLKAFGYTDDDTSIETQMPKDTDNSTYLIKNTYQMDLVRNYSGSAGTGKAFKLANNIDISPAQYNKSQDSSGSWSPIGTGSSLFYASFDGNGNTISGIYINSLSNNQGLFGSTSTVSAIKNVSITNGYVKGGSYVGSIVGSALGTVASCCNTGAVSGSSNDVGGVAGKANTISNCYNTGAVSSAGAAIGGIVGLATAEISNSNNTGAVSSSSRTVGGIAGQANQAVSNCSNTGAVSSTGSYVGGMIGQGYSTSATITSCSNTGKVSGTGNDVGGIAGYASGTVESCYNTGEVSSKGSYVGGVVGRAGAAISSCYNTGAVSCTVSYVGGVAGYAGNPISSCYNIGAVSGTVSFVGGVVGRADMTPSNNYYCGYSGGVGQNGTATAVDAPNGTIPFISCKNSLSTGDTTDISEHQLKELNADFRAAFGISDIQYPDDYESSNSGVLTVSGKQVTAVAEGTASVNGKAGSNSNANIVITQNALNMTAASAGFSGAGTTKATGKISLPITVAASINKQLQSIPTPSDITNIANGAAKTAEALNLPTTILLITDNGTVSASVHWNVDASSYDASKTTAQTFTVTGTVTLPAGVDANGISLSTSISVTVKAASGGDTGKATITGFQPLDDKLSAYTVNNGVNFSSLNLPKKLGVIGKDITGLFVKVTEWVCSNYDSSVAGVYKLKPVLDSGYVGSGYVDSGYVIGSGVSLPEITVTVKGKSSSGDNNSNHHSSNTPSSPSTTKQGTETKVDTARNTATVTTKPDSVTTNATATAIEVTVPSVIIDNTLTSTNGNTVDTAKKTVVTINLPTEDIKQQLAAKKNVELTLTVPSGVANDTNENLAVTINAGKEILEAARGNLSDVTIKIKDADTQQLAYSWTFKGADLAKSTTPLTDVNISMSVHLTTEVPKVNVLTPSNKGLVLSFDHSGVLPSVVGIKFSALEKGFKPGQTLYFYYYNPTTKQIDPLGSKYTVDAAGNITVQILHCSDYVLLPNAARSITLDTRTYTMGSKNSYEIGVTLTNAPDTFIKAYSSTKGVVNVTVLKNGNVNAIGAKPGLTYVMIDVYDKKKKFLTHASVRVIVQNGVKPSGNSARQYGIF